MLLAIYDEVEFLHQKLVQGRQIESDLLSDSQKVQKVSCGALKATQKAQERSTERTIRGTDCTTQPLSVRRRAAGFFVQGTLQHPNLAAEVIIHMRVVYNSSPGFVVPFPLRKQL